MLKTHHLLSQIPLRADTAVRRLRESIWWDSVQLEVSATAPGPALIPWKTAVKRAVRRVKTPSAWGKLFDQRWCRIDFEKKTDGRQWLHWKDQGEATLYVKGRPYFGFDVAHGYCRLPAGLKEAWVEANCVNSAIWHPESRGLSARGSVFEGAFLVRRDDDAWHVWHDMKCLLDVALSLRQQENKTLLQEVAPGHTQPAVDRYSPAFRQMLRRLDDAADIIDAQGPAAARTFLAEAYEALRSDRALMTAVLTGHAHIDLVWLWPERIAELKAVHTFSTVNRLMEEYPEFRFAYSQPASYEAVRRRAPWLFDKIQQRIKSGQWQATGALYVESDTQIACGEALLRSFLIGQKFFEEINGSPATLAWLPDVFGYAACLPQMMQLAGVRYFFTTKMTWNLVNRFPYSSFVWRGHDGSEVITHVTQDCGYNTSMQAGELKAAAWGHQQGDLHLEYLLPTGYGDGGGGPTAEMCERARRMAALPGMPGITWDHPESFFARLDPLKERLPVLKGECYMEGHRGTFTTHAAAKAAFRGLERALQVSEAASCLTGRAWERLDAWKRLVFYQFHDFIPGSSVWDVYREGISELEQLAAAEAAKTLSSLKRSEGEESVFNPHAVEVTRWIRSARSKNKVRVRLPALSGSAISTVADDPEADAEVKNLRVSNGLVDFRLNKDGWIDQLRWKDREARLAGPAGQLMYFHDKPSRFEAWDLDRHTLASGVPCAERPQIEPFRENYRAGLRVKRKIGEGSSVEVTFFLEAGSPHLHVVVELDWQDPYALLKFLVPTDHLATNARYGVPYGSVLRPQVVSGPISEAMWEVPFSRWLAVFDEGESEGLFAVSEDKYGVTVRDGMVGISLVRSPKAVGHDGLRSAWPPHLSRLKGTATHTDLGRHRIRLAFGEYHSSLARAAHPASLADTLFTDPVAYRGPAFASSIESINGGDTLIPAWAQPLDSGSWILRLHEAGGRRGTARFVPAAGWVIARCDAGGESEQPGTATLDLDFQPYQIVSILFQKA